MEKRHVERGQALFLCFLFYAVLGWCYEVFLEVVIYRWGFSNRGFLWGPYCPVYGFGALLLLACLRGLMRREFRCGRVNLTPILVFLAAMALTTAVELAASYLMEYFTGGWLWDYTRYRWQFEGRICLSASVRFGLGSLLILYGIQPLFEKGLARLGARRNIVFWVLFVPFCADLIGKLIHL
ncbi:MAG: putative ABC transporter permease [Butyricicoccus sp.]|nr:putative ABC transporter permease [Butyricicoccus sp.]